MTDAKKPAKTEADKLRNAGINASRANLTLIEPEALTLITDRTHPLYDERVNHPVDPTEPLYLDIERRGVEKPIEVRKNGEDRDGRPILQVVDGRQRVMILRHINAALPEGQPKRKLPVNFVVGDDRSMVLRGLSSNLLRREETPFSKALKMHKALSLGCSLEEIATACNLRDTRIVEEHLLIMNFVPAVQHAFHGTLPAAAIKTFAKVPREEQDEALKTIVAGGAKTKREVEAAVKASRSGEKYVAPKAPAKISTDKLTTLIGDLTKLCDSLTDERDTFDPTDLSDDELEAIKVIETRYAQTRGAIAILEYLTGVDGSLTNFPHLTACVMGKVGDALHVVVVDEAKAVNA